MLKRGAWCPVVPSSRSIALTSGLCARVCVLKSVPVAQVASHWSRSPCTGVLNTVLHLTAQQPAQVLCTCMTCLLAHQIQLSIICVTGVACVMYGVMGVFGAARYGQQTEGDCLVNTWLGGRKEGWIDLAMAFYLSISIPPMQVCCIGSGPPVVSSNASCISLNAASICFLLCSVLWKVGTWASMHATICPLADHA